MNKRIEAYLSELDRLLCRSMPTESRVARVAEIRAHLHLSVRDLIAQGKSGDDASLEALRKLGSAQNVADDLSRQARGYSSKSSWRLVLPALAFILIVDVLMFVLPLVMLNDTTYWMAMTKWSWVPLFALFSWQVWKSRRWLVAPVVVFMIGSVVVPGLGLRLARAQFSDGRGYYRGVNQSDMKTLRDAFDHNWYVDSRLAKAEKTYQSVLHGGHAPLKNQMFEIPGRDRYQVSSWVPGTIIPASYFRLSGYGVQQEFAKPIGTMDQTEADRRWVNEGPLLISALREERETVQHDRMTWPQGKPESFSEVMESFGGAMLTIGFNTAFLFAANALVLGLAAVSRKRRNERDPLIA